MNTFNNFRESGRTTRMMKDVLKRISETRESVYVIFNTNKEVEYFNSRPELVILKNLHFISYQRARDKLDSIS